MQQHVVVSAHCLHVLHRERLRANVGDVHRPRLSARADCSVGGHRGYARHDSGLRVADATDTSVHADVHVERCACAAACAAGVSGRTGARPRSRDLPDAGSANRAGRGRRRGRGRCRCGQCAGATTHGACDSAWALLALARLFWPELGHFVPDAAEASGQLPG